MILAAIAVISLVSACLLLRRKFAFWARKGVPHLKPLPIVGNFLDIALFRKSIPECFDELCRRAGDVPYFGIWQFATPNLVVKEADVIKRILARDFESFPDRAVLYCPAADPVLAEGLQFLPGPRWRAVRGKVSPCLSGSKVKKMTPAICLAAAKLADYVSALNLDESVEARSLSARYTLQAVGYTILGVEANAFDEEEPPLKRIADGMFKFEAGNAARAFCYFFFPALVRLLRFSFFKGRVTEAIVAVVEESFRQHEEATSRKHDLISFLGEMKTDSDAITDNEMLGQPCVFFAVGTEALASAFSFALYELCLNPGVQERLREEISSAYERHGRWTYDALQELTYLDRVVKETLRKYPTLPFLDRTCRRQYKMPGGDVLLDEGQRITVPVFTLHRDPRHYEDPHKFDPDRFAGGKVKDFAYLPFGGGPRQCIGIAYSNAVLKAGLAHLLRRFKVSRNERTKVPLDFEVKSFFLEPSEGLHMTVTAAN